MKKLTIILGLAAALALTGIFWKDAVGRLKAGGYVRYTPEEAQALAYKKCSQCHNTDRIAKYCMRCGPPLAVVVHNMKTLVRLDKERGKPVEPYTDAQAVAIAEVWNAEVGNWEDAWRMQDLVRLLEGDRALIKLIETPVKERRIETALAGRSAPGVYKEIMQKPLKN